MIAYQVVDSELQTILWAISWDVAHGPEKRRQYINDAIEEISESGILRFLILRYDFTTTGDRNIYTTPVQFSTVALFRDGKMLVENQDWVRDSLAEEYPDLISIWTEDIIFPDSTDTSAYTLKYRWSPILLSTDDPSTASIVLPANFKKALVPLAASYGFRQQNNAESGAIKYGEYINHINRLKGAFVNRSERNPTRVSSGHRF
jgi:hypothetical protein